jgi:hypothetical protein
MNAVDRAGAFRFLPQEWGVGETNNGYPQFVVRLKAMEFYDEDGSIGGKPETWVPWGEYDQELTAYLVLYTKDAKTGQWKELLNAGQIKKALGWDGASFAALANGNYANTLIMGRVEEHEYNGQTSLRVQWIDAADASPNRTMAKYDAEKLKGLDAKFAGVIKPAPTPASAPKSATPKGAPKGKLGRPPKAASSPTPASPAPTSESKPVADAPKPPVPSAPKTETPGSDDVTTCTKDQAWEAACTATSRDAAVTDDKLAEVWVEEVTKINADEAKITPIQWATIRQQVIDRTSGEHKF